MSCVLVPTFRGWRWCYWFWKLVNYRFLCSRWKSFLWLYSRPLSRWRAITILLYRNDIFKVRLVTQLSLRTFLLNSSDALLLPKPFPLSRHSSEVKFRYLRDLPRGGIFLLWLALKQAMKVVVHIGLETRWSFFSLHDRALVVWDSNHELSGTVLLDLRVRDYYIQGFSFANWLGPSISSPRGGDLLGSFDVLDGGSTVSKRPRVEKFVIVWFCTDMA